MKTFKSWGKVNQHVSDYTINARRDQNALGKLSTHARVASRLQYIRIGWDEEVALVVGRSRLFLIIPWVNPFLSRVIFGISLYYHSSAGWRITGGIHYYSFSMIAYKCIKGPLRLVLKLNPLRRRSFSSNSMGCKGLPDLWATWGGLVFLSLRKDCSPKKMLTSVLS